MSETREPKRIKLPAKSEASVEVVVPSLDNLMNDAMSIISSELAQYRSKTARGITLSSKESIAVRGYLETLIKLSKELREQARSEDLSNMSDEELLKMLAEVAKIDFRAGESDK